MVRLVVDGADDADTRGLLVLSALALAADDLSGVHVHVLNGEDAVVRTAVESLAWDTGLTMTMAPAHASPDDEIAGAALFVAVVARSSPVRPAAAAARAAGVLSLIAVQFPGPDIDARSLTLVRAAHDPRVLARAILDLLGLSR